ncbi:M20/M25/M40 family metallo-hydrolase [Oleiharenicola lentus]|uniref:M20/M25/M40 family metallo-hydrolase n=1 Tax=Oleiharenicola lentus TaxID=2508720 RepID=UPI003F67563E
MPPSRCLASLFFIPALLFSAPLSPEEQKIVAYVDAHAADFARDLETAVNLDSATENHVGVRKVGELFGAQLEAAGFKSKFIDLGATTGRAGHLFAERTGMKGKRVLLIGHLDTVLPGGNFRREGNKAFGSGVNDIKGGDLVLTHALRALHGAGVLNDTQIIVMMTGDEEAVGSPQELARKDLWDAAKRSDVALSFETAIGNTATVARRGSMSWEIEVQGATGHSSGIFSASMGAGSVYEAARIVSEFYQELRKFDGLTSNPALIVGGTEVALDRTGGTTTGKTNITAQRTLIRGDLRTLSAEQLAQAQAKMREIVARNLPRTSAKITFNEGYPAMPDTPANRELLAQLDTVSRDLGFGEITAYDPKSRGAGDVAFISPPLPAIDGLGLRGNGAHAPAESADLESAPELVKRAAVLIYRLTR